MGLGAYHGADDTDRRQEIVNWFVEDEHFPRDKLMLLIGAKLIQSRLAGKRGDEIYKFPGVGRVIYLSALTGLIEGKYQNAGDFPDWLKVAQLELAGWLRGAPKRKCRYFLDMANLESYELRPHARSDPRGQYE